MTPFQSTTLCFLISSLAGCSPTLLSTSGTAGSLATAPAIPAASTCEQAPFDPAVVESKTASSTVLVSAGQGTGSGFLLREGREQLVVTNYHVVAAGSPHAARITLADGRTQSVALEVVLVSRDDDLALLRPTAEFSAAPLALSAEPPRIGEAVAVLGYPGVPGSELRLTFEPGTVTATRRDVGGSVFIQTNANINPGNSGGPLVDRCGRVMGVVDGKHRTTERVGLAVPADTVARLLARYRAPRPTKQAAVEQQLQSLLTEVRFRRGDRAARFFGRAYVEKTAAGELLRAAESATQKITAFASELKKRGKDPSKMPREVVEREISARLDPPETKALDLGKAIKEGRLSAFDAANQFLSWIAADRFGEIDDLWVESVQATKEGCMDAYLTAAAAEGSRRYVVHLHDELGEWLVQSIKRVR